ncbi:MAG TPA: hypothetical protein VNX68_18830, partial [Nitrosopumilaceae archaeon]|nr:hypothetical protein [Nitrosopumilaceae archaeon]
QRRKNRRTSDRRKNRRTGKKIVAGPTTNCLNCKLFNKCDDPKKNWKYVCQKFKSLAKTNDLSTFDIVKFARKRSDEDEASLDFSRMIERMIAQESSSPLPPDLRIDDGDLPLAKNFFEFSTSDKFLNIKPYPKQLEAAIHLFAEWCPNPKCTDLDYVFNIPKRANYDDILDRVQLLEYGRCPKCKARKSELYRDNKLKVPVELAGLVGQRGGKTACSSMLSEYQLHRYLKLPNASKAFGLLENDELQGSYVAQTWEKAKEKLYVPLYNCLTNTPWFKQYNEMLDHYSERYSEKLYRINELFASYRVRKLSIRPMGPDKRKLRGDTAFNSILDELGWFDASEGNEKKIKQSSSEIYTAMRNAFRTLRAGYYRLLKRGYDNMPPPIFCCISSPSSKRDQIVKNYERSKTSRYIFGQHYASWEYNPTLTRRDFDDDFATDESKAWRDFGAVPPNSAMPYISDIDDLVGIVNRRLRNTVSLSPRTVVSGSGREMRSGKLRFHTSDQNKRLLAIDPGYSGNSFACVAGYLDSDTNRPVFDTMIEIQPTPECPINYNDIYENILGPLTDKLNIKMWVTDRWQNLKLLHDAEADYGVATEQYTVRYSDFESIRQDVYENYITIPKPEMKKAKIELAGEQDYPHGFIHAPVAHLIYQFITVRDIVKSVEKGDGTTDDLFRALVTAYSFIIDAEYKEFCTGKTNQVHNGNPFGGAWGPRGGEGGANSGGTMSDGGVLMGSNGPIGLTASYGQ